MHLTENATEHGEVAITCCLEYTGSSKSLLSVKWFRNRGPTGREMLVYLHRDGLLEYGDKRLHPNLHSFRNSSTEFVLQLWRVEFEDAGEYWCEVTDWQLDGRNWVNHASDRSQRLTLTVLPAGNLGVHMPKWAKRSLVPSSAFPSNSAMSLPPPDAIYRF